MGVWLLLWLPFVSTAAVANLRVHPFFNAFTKVKEQHHYQQFCAVRHLRGGGSPFTAPAEVGAWRSVPAERLQVETVTVCDFLVHGCSTAGLSFGADERYLYERADVTKVWQYLDNTTFGLWLDGGPGTGKSFAVWTWLCRQGTNSRKNFIWIHLYNKYEFKAVHFKHGILRELSGEFSKPDGALPVLLQLIKMPDVDIVVLDGIGAQIPCSEDMTSALFGGNYPDGLIRIGITASVGRIDFKTNADYKLRKGVQFVEMGAWSLDEIKGGTSYKPFLLSAARAIGFTEDEIISIRDLSVLTRSLEQVIKLRIENKYYYAGGSARWMFEYAIPEVVEEIKMCRDELPDINSLLINKGGIRKKDAFNHLLTKIPQCDGYFFTSQYVTRYILQESSSAVLHTAYELGAKQGSSSFLGWVAEFDFIEQLEKASRSNKKAMTMFDPNNQRVEIPVPEVVTFAWKDISSWSTQIKSSCWMRPVAWNEAGFDLVLLKQKRIEFSWRSKYILHFFQVTRGLTHRVDLVHFSDAVVKFQAAVPSVKIEGVSITFITPYTVVQPDVMVPKVELKNEGLLSSFFEGSSKRKKWVEKEEISHIDVLGFQACSIHAV